MVFLMGDDRDAARDSRADGPVTSSSVVGRVDYINLPLDWIAIGVAVAAGAAVAVLLMVAERRRHRARLADTARSVPRDSGARQI
jgi:hypothetical protein